jgi:hypothetical protein
MQSKRFETEIIKFEKKVGIALPFDPNEVWGHKERHHITGTINDCSFRGPLVQEGERYIISLGSAWRRDNHAVVGDQVEVVLSAEGPQASALAPDIVSALAAEPQATIFFNDLATFYRRNYIRWIENAKRPETRAARITEMVALLKAGKKQK